MNPTTIFFCGVILSASGLLSPPLALLAGLLFGFTLQHPLAKQSRDVARVLLQVSVVLLGFGMNLSEVLRAGRSGFGYTAISIGLTIALGLLLGRVLRVCPGGSLLITCGTAICGGSAIAAIAPVSEASEDEIAVSLGTVFTLNAVALLLFPAIGLALHMSQTQFGLWSALAVHDTSSVVGATAKYGPQALEIGTTVKLVRALWIVPVALAIAAIVRQRKKRLHTEAAGARIAVPWFIGLFILAAVCRTYLRADPMVWAKLNTLGKTGLTTVLFLIGTGLSRETLRNLGWRPLLQGVVLWVVMGSASLLAIRAGWISL